MTTTDDPTTPIEKGQIWKDHRGFFIRVVNIGANLVTYNFAKTKAFRGKPGLLMGKQEFLGIIERSELIDEGPTKTAA